MAFSSLRCVVLDAIKYNRPAQFLAGSRSVMSLSEQNRLTVEARLQHGERPLRQLRYPRVFRECRLRTGNGRSRYELWPVFYCLNTTFVIRVFRASLILVTEIWPASRSFSLH